MNMKHKLPDLPYAMDSLGHARYVGYRNKSMR